MKKALALLSGGLDSTLAALIVKNQGVKVTGLAFKSLFFNPESRVKKLCQSLKIPLKIIDFSEKHLQMVKNPSHGYGKNANPCINCHLLMLKEAKKILKKQNYNFVITGEILGQRPFSQNKNSLNLIEKEAGLKGLLLRPLSAKLLAITIPEQKNWVNRERLLDISGRSRTKQFQLVKKFKLSGFSAPGASCILTDPQFSKRLFKLLKINPQAKTNDIQILRLGRHFWQGKNLIIVGRNHEENLALKKSAQKKDIILEPKSFPGPTVLARSFKNRASRKVLDKAEKLIFKYSPKAPKKLTQKDIKICYT